MKCHLVHAPWKKTFDMVIHAWHWSTLMSSHASSMAWRRGGVLKGLAIIDLPPPCWEKFLNRVEERRIWRQVGGQESGMGLKPCLNNLCMAEPDILPHNFICDPFTLTGRLNSIEKLNEMCSIKEPSNGLRPMTPSSEIAAHMEMFPPRCPGTCTVARWPMMFRPWRRVWPG